MDNAVEVIVLLSAMCESPELAFLPLAGQPMRYKKKTLADRRERAALVAPCFGDHFIEPQEAQKGYSRSQVALDDVLDAYALAMPPAVFMARAR